MEGTQSQVVNSPSFKGNKLLDNIHNLCCIEDPFYGLAVNHMSKISGNQRSCNNLLVNISTPLDAGSFMTSTFLLTGTYTSFGSMSQSEAFAGA